MTYFPRLRCDPFHSNSIPGKSSGRIISVESHNDGMFDRVFQLADIPWPIVSHQKSPGFRRIPLSCRLVHLLGYMVAK